MSVAKPPDFEPLAAGGPVPGDPDEITAVGRRYADTAAEIARQAANLRKLATAAPGGWKGQAGAVFHSHAADLATRIVAELAGGGDQVTWAEVAGSPAIRRQHAGASATVDFFTPVPGRTGLLSLSFGTAAPEPLASALLSLFDAIAGSLRWKS